MADKKEHILIVAERLFGEKGFDGTSIRDIAQKANVNLAMISYYFGSKEKLLEALLEFRAGYTIGLLEELSKDEALTPFDKIDRLIDFYVDKILGNICFHNIMQQQSVNTKTEEIRDMITEIKVRNFEQIKKIISDGQRKKVFRKIDIELTMGTMMGTISQFTQLRPFWTRLFNIDTTDDEAYRKKIAPRLKTHLKQLLKTHLDIKNEE